MFLAHAEKHREPNGLQQEEKMVTRFKETVIKKSKRLLSVLKKTLTVCLRLGNWKGRKIAVSWRHENFARHYRLLRKSGLKVVMNELKLFAGNDGRMMTSKSMCAAIEDITASDERKYRERGITWKCIDRLVEPFISTDGIHACLTSA